MGDKFTLSQMSEDEMSNLLKEKLQIKEQEKKALKAEVKIETFEKEVGKKSRF